MNSIKYDRHMVKAVIFTTKDLGKSYRLLRHAKVFHEMEDGEVVLIGPEFRSLPRELSRAENVSYRNISIIPYSFPWTMMLFPISILWRVIQVFAIFFRISNADLIITATGNGILDPLFAWLGKKIFKAKMVLDVAPFKYTKVSKSLVHVFLRALEVAISKIADTRIVSTNAMHVLLKIKQIDSILIQDEPGTNFKPRPEQRQSVAELLGVSNECKTVSIPVPNLDQETQRKLISFIQNLDQKLTETVNFVVFCEGKVREGIEKAMQKYQLEHAKLHVFSMHTDIYCHILGSCDLGICFTGSHSGLDISSELLEMVACGVPILVYRYGSVIEYVNHGKTGFVFSSENELSDLLYQIFIQKTIDLAYIRSNCKPSNTQTIWNRQWNKILHEKLD